MAVGDEHVFPGFLTPILTQISFQSHRLLFSHASPEVRGENTPERNLASIGSRIHNHQAMRSTRSPLSHPGGRNENERTHYTPAKRTFSGLYWNQPVCPSVHVSVRVSVGVQNNSSCQSKGGGIKSHLVTGLVL